MKQIKTIVHSADYHIRTLSRHNEYREVFQQVYDNVKKLDKETSVFVIAGDIVHTKTTISPEQVDLVREFLMTLSELIDIIIIPGNHDCNLQNKERDDILSPIIKAINRSNIYYYKTSGIYTYNNIDFIHYSVFNDIENYPVISESKNKYKIGLYHGVPGKALTPTGFVLENNNFDSNIFTHCDLVLYGDVHLQQFFDKEETRGMVGSLLQQNFGELIQEHGMLLWDLPTKKHTFIELNNRYCYQDIVIIDNKLTINTDEFDINKIYRFQLTYNSGTSVSYLRNLESDLRAKFNVEYLVHNKMKEDKKINTLSNVSQMSSILSNLTDVNVQNKLIDDFYKDKLKEDQLEIMHQINERINKSVKFTDKVKLKWLINELWFDNMFAYGEGNYINFNTLTGKNIGLLANNSAGKTSLLNVICFMLFDTTPKSYKPLDILHHGTEQFNGKLKFTIDDIEYVIEKTGVLNKQKDSVKVDINFYKVVGEEQVSLNGTERASTRDNIKKYVGDLDDFIITHFSLQGKHDVFIDYTQSERKVVFNKFIGTDLFETLHEAANEELKEHKPLLKKLKQTDYKNGIVAYEFDINKCKTRLIELGHFKTEQEDKIDKLTQEKESLTLQLINVSVNVTDPEISKDKIKQVQDRLLQIDIEKQGINNRILQIKEQANKIKEEQATFLDIDTVNVKYNEYLELNKQVSESNNKVLIFENQLSNLQNKVKILERIKLGDNCNECFFVKDALDSKKLILDTNTQLEQAKKAYNEIFTKEQELKQYVDIKKKIEDIEKKKQVLVNEYQTLNNKQLTLENEVLKLNNEIEQWNKKVEEFDKVKQDIEKNKGIQELINNVNTQITTYKTKLKETNDFILQVNSELTLFNNKLETLLAQQTEFLQEEITVKNLTLYCDAMHKDGIPVMILRETLPYYEQEVNTILSQLVDFKIVMLFDEGNVDINICYDNPTRMWSSVLSGGMERFILSTALRIGLIQISNKSETNFLILDEGFGALDSNNLQNIQKLMDLIKNRFDFSIIITHLESMRDMIDTQIGIEKVGSESKIYISL